VINEYELKIVFGDVVRNYSIVRDTKYGDIYIRHLSLFDAAEIDSRNAYYYNKAKNQKLPTNEERLDFLLKEKIWTKEKEHEILTLQSFVSRLKLTKTKLHLPSQIEKMNKDIQKNETELFKIEKEKANLIGFTAEVYALKRMNEHYMFTSLYKDSKLDQRLFTEESYDDLNETEVQYLVNLYNENSTKFTEKNLKKVALMPFFLNFFYLCKSNPFTFYGKPVTHLTFYQAELFSYGLFFKNIFQNAKVQPPEDIAKDPEALTEWYQAINNAEKLNKDIDVTKPGAQVIMGATSKDLKMLGLKNDAGQESMFEKARKHGGSLNMKQMIE
jgi:hypothetical protein